MGSYENIGATRIKFNNFKWDLQAYAEGVHGELIVKNFNQKRKVLESFFFFSITTLTKRVVWISFFGHTQLLGAISRALETLFRSMQYLEQGRSGVFEITCHRVCILHVPQLLVRIILLVVLEYYLGELTTK